MPTTTFNPKRIQTLGGLAVLQDGRPLGGSAQQPRRLAILAILARAGDRGVARERLITLLWPDTGEERAKRSLNQALYALRQELGSEEIFLGTRELRLNPDLLSSDLAEFESAAASGALELAARAYGGPFLGDFTLPGAVDFARWAERERATLETEHVRVVEAAAITAAKRGDWGGAVLWWRRMAALDPHDSGTAQGLMRALAAAGDVPGALRHAEIHAAMRQQELELSPDPDVVALADRIRKGELPPVARPSAAITAPEQPISPKQVIDTPSVAVLPFINMSPGGENEYFSDGLTEELTNALTHVAGLRVVSRTSAFALKGKDLDAPAIGTRLGVSLLVEGSVRAIGNRIRVTVQLVNAADGYYLWSQAFDRMLTDVFALQDEVARSVVVALGRQGASPDLVPWIPPPTTVVEAYTLYLRGRYFVMKRTPESLRVAREYFEQALELDPGYALAHAGLAECWGLLGFEEFGDMPPVEVMPRAQAAAQRALEIDPSLAEGHLWLGVVQLLFGWDLDAAATALRRAHELKPSVSLMLPWQAMVLTLQGRPQEALQCVEEAERLDPVSIPAQSVFGRCLFFVGRFDEARKRFEAVLQMEQTSLATSWLARTQVRLGHPDVAVALLEAGFPRWGRQPLGLEVLGVALATQRRFEEARKVLAELEDLARIRHVSPAHRLAIHAHLGEEEAVLACLRECVQVRSGYVAYFRVLDGARPYLHSPRMTALMAELGVPVDLRPT